MVAPSCHLIVRGLYRLITMYVTSVLFLDECCLSSELGQAGIDFKRLLGLNCLAP